MEEKMKKCPYCGEEIRADIIRKTICSTIVKRSDVFSKRNVFFLFPLHYKNNVIIIAF